ncbi:MAG: geranylgeranylglyceryl/heptaprenylglyceryl phosphate synthase, partial [Candidatus Bathyarchaeia archaeon]
MGPIEKYLIDKIRHDGAIHMTLIDPEKVTASSVLEIVGAAEEAGTSAIMVGGSTATSVHQTDAVVKGIKSRVEVPLILFPSNVTSISSFADAIWFMSLLNSTNPYFMAGAQALGAPLIKQYGLEPLPLGYIIVGEGGVAAFIGQARPIPYDKPEVAMIYALAAQYLGMRFVYLEAGSGAKRHVPPEMITMVRKVID